jgi:hypothetical protein
VAKCITSQKYYIWTVLLFLRPNTNDSVMIPGHSEDNNNVPNEYKTQMWHLTAGNVNTAVFVDITLCSLVNRLPTCLWSLLPLA